MYHSDIYARLMNYLKENKALILLALIILPALYFDSFAISWVKANTAFYFEDVYQPAVSAVKFLTHGTTLIIFSLLLFLFSKLYSPPLINVGKTLFIGLITSGLAVQVFKHLIGRARPRVTVNPVFVGPSVHGDYDAFPSGHTTLAFCFAAILSHYYPRYSFIFYLFAVFTGVDRLIGFSHFPSDILAGALLGTITAKIVTARTVPLSLPEPSK